MGIAAIEIVVLVGIAIILVAVIASLVWSRTHSPKRKPGERL